MIGCTGAVVSVAMLISAFQFLECGRVLLYLFLTLICAEVGIYGIMGAVKKKN